MRMRVFQTATVEQAIEAILEQASSEGKPVAPQSSAYELRLHEMDGFPDTDMPREHFFILSPTHPFFFFSSFN